MLASHQLENLATKETQKLVKLMSQLLAKDNAKASTPGQGKSKTARRRRNKKQNNVVSVGKPLYSTGAQLQRTSGANTADMFERPSGRGSRYTDRQGVSQAGQVFLKSVFAPPDFAVQGAFKGIPDDVTALICPYRHIYNGDLLTAITAAYAKFGAGIPVTTNPTIYLIQPPVPGVAAYVVILDAGVAINPSTIFYPITYTDFDRIFGVINGTPSTPNADLQVTNFRFAANSMELVCTANANTWTGNIRAFKCKLDLADCQAYNSTGVAGWSQSKSITGIEVLNSTGSACYIAPTNMGIFMTAVDTEATFISSAVPDKLLGMNGSDPSSFGVLSGTFPGLGNLQTNVVIIENWQHGNPTTFMFRAWSALEYTPLADSLLYKCGSESPYCDPVALELYKALVKELPIAVSYFDNESFWARLLGVVKKIAGGLSFIPGPIGAIAGGVGTVANALGEL